MNPQKANIEKLDFKKRLLFCGNRQNPCGMCFGCTGSISVPKDKDIMVIVVDYDCTQKYLRGRPERFHMLVDAVQYLCRKHIEKRTGNDVLIFGCSKSGVHQVFSAQKHLVKDVWVRPQQDLLASLKVSLNEKLITRLRNDQKTTQDPAELHERTQILQSVGRSLAYITARRRALKKPVNAKIILVSGSDLPDGSPYFFGKMLGYAKSMSVKIDVFSIASPLKPALLLAANKTGGKYMDIPKVEDMKKTIKKYMRTHKRKPLDTPTPTHT